MALNYCSGHQLCQEQAHRVAQGMAVRHERFGDGTVQRVTARTVTVLFDHGVYRRLALDLAAAGRLRPA